MKSANRYPLSWDVREENYDTGSDINFYTLEEASDRMPWTLAIEAEGRVDLTRQRDARQAELKTTIGSLLALEEDYLMVSFEESENAFNDALKDSRAAQKTFSLCSPRCTTR